MTCDNTTEFLCGVVEEACGTIPKCNTCVKKGAKKLDTETSSWYKDNVKKDTSENLTTNEEGITMATETNKTAGQADQDKVESTPAATPAEHTFKEKAAECCKKVRGPMGWMLLGASLLAGGVKGYQTYKNQERGNMGTGASA